MKNPWKSLSEVSPQREEGNRQIANDIFKALIKSDLSSAEYKVCLCIIDKTWGYGKAEDAISSSQFMATTGLSESAVKKTLAGLKNRRIICSEPSKIKGPRGSFLSLFMFNKHYDTWKVKRVYKRTPFNKKAEDFQDVSLHGKGCINVHPFKDISGDRAERVDKNTPLCKIGPAFQGVDPEIKGCINVHPFENSSCDTAKRVDNLTPFNENDHILQGGTEFEKGVNLGIGCKFGSEKGVNLGPKRVDEFTPTKEIYTKEKKTGRLATLDPLFLPSAANETTGPQVNDCLDEKAKKAVVPPSDNMTLAGIVMTTPPVTPPSGMGHDGAMLRYDKDMLSNGNAMSSDDMAVEHNGETVTSTVMPTEKPAPKGKRKAVEGKRFVPPTVEEVGAYCRERQNRVDAQAFIDHYETVGWVYGKGSKPIKDWKACVRTWEARDKNTGLRPEPASPEVQARLEQRIRESEERFEEGNQWL